MAFPRAPTSSSSSHERSSRSRKRPPRRRPATHALHAKAPSTVQKMPALVAASSRIVAPAQLKARAAPARRVVAVHAVASAKCVIRSLHIRASRGVPARVDALAARLAPRPTPRCRLSTSRRGSAIVVQTAGAPSLTPSPRPHRRHTEGEARFPLKTVAVAGASPPLPSAVPSLPRPTREPTNKTTDCRRMMMHLCARRSANGPLRERSPPRTVPSANGPLSSLTSHPRPIRRSRGASTRRRSRPRVRRRRLRRSRRAEGCAPRRRAREGCGASAGAGAPPRPDRRLFLRRQGRFQGPGRSHAGRPRDWRGRDVRRVHLRSQRGIRRRARTRRGAARRARTRAGERHGGWRTLRHVRRRWRSLGGERR